MSPTDGGIEGFDVCCLRFAVTGFHRYPDTPLPCLS